jgi:nitroreductase
LIVVVARPDLWRRGQQINLEFFDHHGITDPRLKAYYEKLVPLTYGTDPLGISGGLKSLIAAAIGIFRPSYRGPFGPAGNRLWAAKTSALAAENLMLAFRAAGYDTCPMEGFDQKRAKKLLKLPCGAYITMILGVGRRAEKGVYGPQIRGSRDLFIHRV